MKPSTPSFRRPCYRGSNQIHFHARNPTQDRREIQWKVAIERLYEYKDAVTLNLALPGNLKGVTLKKANIDKDKTEAQIGFKASDKATPGEFLAKLDASLRINGQTIKLSEEVKVKVQAAPTEQAGS